MEKLIRIIKNFFFYEKFINNTKNKSIDFWSANERVKINLSYKIHIYEAHQRYLIYKINRQDTLIR